MKLGIMQPYFFPYLGYFTLIANTDHFIFFDTPQYERRSWMNRNRILNSNKVPAYITVPLQHAPQKTAIKDIRIDYSTEWLLSMISRMVHYEKYAPYYNDVIGLFASLLTRKYSSLAEMNIETIIAVSRYLGITTSFDTFSEMNLAIAPVSAPDEWALNITKRLGFSTYRNPPGGMSFFDREKYSQAGIKLEFLMAELPSYDQRIDSFEGSLSIIDVMMFNSKPEITKMLGEYTLL